MPHRMIKAPKAATADECATLEQLPNVGPAMARDLRLIGIHRPADLRERDAHALYRELERATGRRQDPCVLDSFLAIVDFMGGAAPQPWWAYTAARKQLHGQGLRAASGSPSQPLHPGRQPA
jgi:hypothetical protein